MRESGQKQNIKKEASLHRDGAGRMSSAAGE